MKMTLDDFHVFLREGGALDPEIAANTWYEIKRQACLGAETEATLQMMFDPENQPPQWSAEEALQQLRDKQIRLQNLAICGTPHGDRPCPNDAH